MATLWAAVGLVIAVPFLWYIIFDLFYLYITKTYEKASYQIKRCGSWAIVTGGGGGIGRGYALALAKRHLNVCLIGRTEDHLKKTAKDVEAHGVKTMIITHDFSTPNQKAAEASLSAALEPILKDVAILVNNVGTMMDPSGFATPFLMRTPSSLEYARTMVATNIDSALLMTSIVAPHLIEKKRGVLVFLGSACAVTPFYGEAVYCATKSFIEFFADALRQEVEPHGLFVLTHAPSFVRTALIPKLCYDCFPSLLVAEPTDVADNALRMIGVQTKTDGCWQHSLQNNTLRLLHQWAPKRILDWFLKTLAQNLHVADASYRQQKVKIN